jgi:hypothetical protein
MSSRFKWGGRRRRENLTVWGCIRKKQRENKSKPSVNRLEAASFVRACTSFLINSLRYFAIQINASARAQAPSEYSSFSFFFSHTRKIYMPVGKFMFFPERSVTPRIEFEKVFLSCIFE